MIQIPMTFISTFFFLNTVLKETGNYDLNNSVKAMSFKSVLHFKNHTGQNALDVKVSLLGYIKVQSCPGLQNRCTLETWRPRLLAAWNCPWAFIATQICVQTLSQHILAGKLA